jgi:hypothetical protein
MGRHLVSLAMAVMAVAALAASSACGHATPGPVTFFGTARLDGAAFDSKWIGAVVLHDGLATPCQGELPPVDGGRYEVTVLAAASDAGCGRRGDRVVFWIYAGDRIVYATNAAPWPAAGTRSSRFAVNFSSSTPDGVAPVTAQFSGTVHDAHGKVAAVGTTITAEVGGTRCGVASVRRSGSFVGYVVAVVGPDAIPGCALDEPVRFRIDGKPAVDVDVRNHPPGVKGSTDLRQQ